MILLKNGKIYTMAGQVLESGDILIEDGKIKEIGIGLDYQCETIDLEGQMVLPGFIDAHCHVGLFDEGMGFEGSDGNEMVDPVTPHLRAIDGIYAMDVGFEDAYKGGVTTTVTGPGSANVIGGMFSAVKTYGTSVDEMILREDLAMKIAFGENPKRVYNSQGKSPITRMAVAAILRENLIKAKNYADKKDRAKGDLDKFPEYNIKMEALERVIRKEIPLKAHVHRSDDILTAIRIAKEFDLNLTLDHCTEGHLIKEHLAKDKIPAIVGPSLSNRSKIELRNRSFETPSILHNEGIKIAIMTDAPVIPIEYLSLCAGLAVKSGLDEMEALRAITINPAEIIGIDDRVGSLEIGKDADIVVFSSNPLEDIGSKTVLTMIDGKVIYKS